MSANERQVGGSHYKREDGGEEHWDRVARLGLDYFQGQITKYVERWKHKNGLQDLEKAQHFLEKYIELVKAERIAYLLTEVPASAPVEIGLDCPAPTKDDVERALGIGCKYRVDGGDDGPNYPCGIDDCDYCKEKSNDPV